jgi:hypothetical protein
MELDRRRRAASATANTIDVRAGSQNILRDVLEKITIKSAAPPSSDAAKTPALRGESDVTQSRYRLNHFMFHLTVRLLR